MRKRDRLILKFLLALSWYKKRPLTIVENFVLALLAAISVVFSLLFVLYLLF